MPKNLTAIELSVVENERGAMYEARCPHVPDDRYAVFRHPEKSHLAINGLIAQVREWARDHPDATPWIAKPQPGKCDERMELTGLWPKKSVEPDAGAGTDLIQQEHDDGN